MYERKDIESFGIQFSPLMPIPMPSTRFIKCPISIDIESEESKHKINCCIYISKLLFCLLGGSAGFIGADSAFKSFDFSDESSFAFGLIGMSTISIIGLNSLSPFPVKGEIVPAIERDKRQKLLSVLNPISGFSCGMLTSKSADLIFSSLGFDPNRISSALNIILAFTAGITSYISFQKITDSRNAISVNYDNFLEGQRPSIQFFLKFIGAVCYISSLMVITCLLPGTSTLITNNINDDLITKISSYLFFGIANYGIGDLYFNCFKIFIEKLFYLISNFGIDKFKNIIIVIIGALFLFVQSVSGYGLGYAGSQGTALSYGQKDIKAINMVCGAITAIGTASAATLSGFSVAETMYSKIQSLYRLLRNKFQ